MPQRVHNVHLDAIAFVRQAAGADYGTALRLCQLYGFLEYLTQRGVGCLFNQSGYAEKTGCSRPTIRADLARLAQLQWIEVQSSVRGTTVRILGLPFEQDNRLPVAQEAASEPVENPVRCPAATGGVCPSVGNPVSNGLETPFPSVGNPVSNYKKCSNTSDKNKDLPDIPSERLESPLPPEEGEEPQVPIWQTRPRPWSKAKREAVREIWNAHKPPNFAPLAEGGLDADRAAVAARCMDGRGGYKAFMEKLPQVLDSLHGHPFWGDRQKQFAWDHFMGTLSRRKTHWAQTLDALLTSPCQGLQPDRRPLRYEAFGDQWIPLRSDLSTDDIVRAAIDLVRDGLAPREALQYLEPWTPDHPHMATLND